MYKFPYGCHRTVAILKVEGHKEEYQKAQIKPLADVFKLIYYPLSDLEVQNYVKTIYSDT